MGFRATCGDSVGRVGYLTEAGLTSDSGGDSAWSVERGKRNRLAVKAPTAMGDTGRWNI